MVLEQDPSGLWMYSRPAWAGGPAIVKNGVSPGITNREDAARIVNILYPGAFPEEETKRKPKEGKSAPAAPAPAQPPAYTTGQA